MKNLINALLIVAGITLVAAPIANAETTTKSSTETTGQAFDSSLVTTAVIAKLKTTKNIKSNRIHVTSFAASKGDKSNVTLSGTQPSEELVTLAGKTAQEVDGVGTVQNNLTVAPK